MKRARFSEEQIIAVLKEAEAGAKVTELCRRHGISDATFYTWRSKYGGLEVKGRCAECVSSRKRAKVLYMRSSSNAKPISFNPTSL